MRKNINKIVAFAIGISTMSGSIMPVFAADTTQNTSTTNVKTNNIQEKTNQKAVLTLDEAIKSAISISDTLAFDEKNISYQDKINDIKEKQSDFNDDSDDSDDSDDAEDYNKDTSDIKLKKAKQQRDFDEDIIRKKVTDKYNDIVTSQMKISKATKELEIKNIGLENDKVRESLGMTRLIDIKTTKLQIENLQNTQKTNQNKLNDLEYSFKVVTGKDVTQFRLEQDIKFEPLKIDGSIDEYLDKAIDSYLKYSEKLINLNKDYYDKDYEDDNNISSKDIEDAEDDVKSAEDALDNSKSTPKVDSDGNTNTDTTNYKQNLADAKAAYTNKLAARITYLSTKLNNYQDETNLNENKKKFKDSLKGYYTDLRTSEAKINYLKKSIGINNENLSNLKLKYDLGMITESAYNTEIVSDEQSDLDLIAEVTNYNITKEKVQKPWIAFSNAQ